MRTYVNRRSVGIIPQIQPREKGSIEKARENETFTFGLDIRSFSCYFAVSSQTMFFFIAGIQPKSIDLESHPRMCPSCGLLQARLKRMDQYLSIFFLPVLRVKKGSPFLECRSCGSVSHESGEAWVGPSKSPDHKCPHCGEIVEARFRFCPFCGKKKSLLP
jgi:hypothetical protein